MHFAFPQQKTGHPLPYKKATRSAYVRRKQVQLAALIFCGLVLLLYLIRTFSKHGEGRAPPGTPDLVVVTLLDNATMSEAYRKRVIDNRKEYAQTQGYGTFFPDAADYDIGNSPRSWAIVPGLRHALTAFPHTTFFYSLSPHAMIMDPAVNLQQTLLDRPKLESLMLRDKPVVPPDSVIKTFTHLRGDKIDVVLTQDGEGLCQGSFILRRGEWAKFFLDTWFDPLYRSYNFQKAEGHALEHIVQWHPTILTKLALVPTKILNSYNVIIPSRGGDDVHYKKGDFIVRLVGCDLDPTRSCENEFNQYWDEYQLQKKNTASS